MTAERTPRGRVSRSAESRPADRDVRDPLAGGRETVESVVVAFALALLFRAFEAEAFVIPTGSMAPTLMGRHKDLVCDACGAEFRVGCSQELDEASNRIRPERMVSAGRCPNCRNVMQLAVAPGRYDPRYPSFSGDRILVDKFAYDFADPARWDVVVFKYPEDAKTNYIKRLVGLPGETVIIAGGDIWTRKAGGEPVIARKPPAKRRAMLQPVHDSDRVPLPLARAGWPTAWSDWSAAAGPACRWETDDDGRSYSVACAVGQAAELRFRRFVPTDQDWRDARAGQTPARPAPTIVEDDQPYNTNPTRLHQVGDLALEARLVSRSSTGRVICDLVEHGRRHACEIDLETGEARLLVAGLDPAEAATAVTGVRGRGSWRLLFANVDDELSLAVDGRPIDFSGDTTWQSLPDGGAHAVGPPPEPGMPEPSDLAPVGIRVEGADVTLSGLRVLRDVYYIPAVDVGRDGRVIEEPVLEFPLAEDQFFVLGDNSAASKDSRLWLGPHHVDRRLLIGRALAVFWPHAVPARWSVPLTLGGWELRLPSWPNFARMRFVR